MKKPIIAILYDFDKTLCTTDMQNYTFIPNMGMEVGAFWSEVRAFAKENQFDSVLAYLYMMIRKSAERHRPVRRENFVGLGADIDYYPGVSEWFDRINAFAEENGAVVEHYIISSGLKEIIEGSSIGDKFKEIYACEFYYDENGVAVWPKTAVNFTGKTQYFFRINKGVLDVTDDMALNRMTPEQQRRIPFSNMIYIGDGMTDVPCMKLTRVNGGHSIAVYPPNSEKKARQISNQLLIDSRVDFVAPADYTAGQPLDILMQKIIRKIVSDADLRQIHSEQSGNAKEMIAE